MKKKFLRIFLLIFVSIFLIANAQDGSTQQMLQQIQEFQQTGNTPHDNTVILPTVENSTAAPAAQTAPQGTPSAPLMNEQPQGQNQDQTQVQNQSAQTTQAPTTPSVDTNAQTQQNDQHFNPEDHRNFSYPYPTAHIPFTPTEKTIQAQAFENTVKSILPLTPTEVHRMKQLYVASQFAAAAPSGTPPQPTATSMYVNLAPGASPPVIRLSEGFVTSLVFLDGTGAPWPIASYDIGNPQAFNIQWDKKSNVLMVQANSLYTYGNLAVQLRQLNTPIMLTLIPGQAIVDYRVDVTVPAYGPNAQQLPITAGIPGTGSPDLLQVLDGVPPHNSQQLSLDTNIGEAWLSGNTMFLRTRYTLLSPGWIATMSSADGMHVYQLAKTPMLLMSRAGKMIHVKVGGY